MAMYNYSISPSPPMVFFSTNFESTNQNITERSPEIALCISIFAGFCSLITVVGNVIVILSFIINKSLRNFSNYMILSLALSDLTIGAFSMNVFTTYNVNQTWTLGQVMCKAWLSVDYTASNASVMNLLVICIDRYLAITKPVKYRRWSTAKHAAIAITGVWLLSFLMWVPAITLWDVISENASLPEGMCYIPFIKQNSFLSVATIFLAFYFPAFAMCALYQRVIHKIKRRRRGLKSIIQDASVTMVSRDAAIKKFRNKKCQRLSSCDEEDLVAKTSTSSNNAFTVQSTNDIANYDEAVCNNVNNSLNLEKREKLDTLAELSDFTPGISVNVRSRLSLNQQSTMVETLTETSIASNGVCPLPCKPQFDPLHRTSSLRLSKPTANNRYLMKSKSVSYVTSTKNEKEVLTKQITTARETQRTARERKVTVLLKFILLCFILLWLPYSLIVVIAAICPRCSIPPTWWNLSYWLCYLNSTVNPFCYGFCNENFRRTFKAIVTTRWWTQESRKRLRLGRKVLISKAKTAQKGDCAKKFLQS